MPISPDDAFNSGPFSAGALDAARAAGARVTQLGLEGETTRRMPSALRDLLATEGLFQIFVPAVLGGRECGWIEGLGVIEEVSAADGAAGWCLLKVASSNQLSGFVDPAVAAEIWHRPDTLVAGSLNPKGTAIRAPGGWRVTGRWDWGTASTVADWILGGAALCDEGGEPLPGERGPQTRVFVFPAGSTELIDTWHTYGMRGTGSGDFAVSDLLIPDRHAIDVMRLAPTHPGASFRLPYFPTMMLAHAPVAIGIARGALAEFIAFATTKTPLMSKSLLKDKGWVQDVVGRASAEIAASRAYVHSAVHEALDAPAFTPRHALAISLAATHATHRCVAAVDLLMAAAGGSAVFAAGPLQRRFRDLHVAASHFLVNSEKYAGAGRVLFGDSPSPLA